MPATLGLNAKLYYQNPANSTVITDGGRLAWPANSEPPGLTLLSNVQDVTINLERGEADISVRGGNGWRQKVGTLKDGSLEFTMIWDPTDAGFTAIKNAFFDVGGVGSASNVIALVALDGAKATAGFQGLWADFAVLNFTRNEPLEEALTVTVTVTPTRGPNNVAPEWVTTDPS